MNSMASIINVPTIPKATEIRQQHNRRGTKGVQRSDGQNRVRNLA
jgi:hypothetical protein